MVYLLKRTRMITRYSLFFCLVSAVLLLKCSPEKDRSPVSVSADYADLVALFQEWRAFEEPPLREGAPDYTVETFKKRRPDFERLQGKLLAMDTTGWSVEQQVDWHIVWAEMNGYDFNEFVPF